jgi:hypothetical protein
VISINAEKKTGVGLLGWRLGCLVPGCRALGPSRHRVGHAVVPGARASPHSRRGRLELAFSAVQRESRDARPACAGTRALGGCAREEQRERERRDERREMRELGKRRSTLGRRRRLGWDAKRARGLGFGMGPSGPI